MKSNEIKMLEALVMEERKAYFKAWRAKNKDKVKMHNQNYWMNRVRKNLNKNM